MPTDLPRLGLPPRVLGLLLSGILLAVAAPAAAQTSRHVFDDLGRYIEPGDSIYVVTKAQGQVEGRVEALTPTSVRVDVNGARREIPVGDIGWIDRKPDPIWDGVIGGAVGGYAFTFGVAALFCAGGADGCDGRILTDPDMHGTALKLAGLWGALFGLADLARRDRWLVYGVRPGSARDQLRERPRAASVGELWSTVRPDDRVVVRRLDGSEVAGRFQSASAGSIRLKSGDRLLEVAAPQVERVFRRTSRIRDGMLLGPAIGAAYGGLHPGQFERRSDSVVVGALLGWAFGTVAGTALPRRTTVYDSRPAAVVNVVPAVTRDGYGLLASVRF